MAKTLLEPKPKYTDDEKLEVIGKKILYAMIPSLMLILLIATIRLSYTVTGYSNQSDRKDPTQPIVDEMCNGGINNDEVLNMDATSVMQSITFVQGKVTKGQTKVGQKIICLKRVTTELSDRGIMVKIKDDQLSVTSTDGEVLSTKTSWAKLNGTMSSIPFSAPLQREQWFTIEHTHDAGANKDLAKHPYLIMPKGIRSIFGITDDVVFKGKVLGNRNTLVNYDRVTAKERGIDYIIIDTSQYKGTEPITLEFISEKWIYSDFWQIFIQIYLGASWIMFILKMAGAESKWDAPHKCKDPGLWDKFQSGKFVVAELTDLLKGWYYLFFAPHTGLASVLLISSLILPFAFCWISVQLRHIQHEDETFVKEEDLEEIAQAYFCWGNYDRVLKQDFTRVVKMTENLPEIFIFFYENFERGNKMTFLILLFPIISYIGFTTTMGEIVGEQFFSEIKQLRDDEEAEENYLEIVKNRYVYGSLTLFVYLSPCLWIKYLYGHFISEDDALKSYDGFILPIELQQQRANGLFGTLAQVFTDEWRKEYAAFLIVLSIGMFWWIRRSQKTKFKCLNEGCKEPCIKMLQYDLKKKHCLHCKIKIKGNHKLNNGVKEEKPQFEGVRYTGDLTEWDGEEILEAFHVRSMLQCKKCQKKCREHNHKYRKEGKSQTETRKHCAADFYIHVRCYNDYKSSMDGRNWFTKTILGNIPLVKLCFPWKRKTEEQIKKMNKEGSNEDSQSFSASINQDEGGEFEDNFYPMQDLQAIEMTNEVSHTENDDDFHPMN